MPRVRYDARTAWDVVFVAMGMGTVVSVGGMAGANAATAPCSAPRAGGRSADGWLLTSRQVVQRFKAAGKLVGRKYVRSCMRRYLEGGDPGYTRDSQRLSHHRSLLYCSTHIGIYSTDPVEAPGRCRRSRQAVLPLGLVPPAVEG